MLTNQAIPKSKRIVILITVIEEVCQVKWSEVQGRSRKRQIVTARHLFCLFAKSFCHLTLDSIGKKLDNRDHTTAMHSIQTVNNLIDANDEVMTVLYQAIKERLYHEI
jgi:chromosomal replication initiator protein